MWLRIMTTKALVLWQASRVIAASPDEWRSRSIYQVMIDRFALANGSTTAPCDPKELRYCGGTWQGLIAKLDYIQNLGFTAIWISPVTFQIQDEKAYHGYYQTNLYRVNERFGSMQDLKDLAEELHKRDMYLMVDVVVNHNAWIGPPDTVNYTQFYPFNDKRHYHSYCAVTDYDNQTNIEDCWLGDGKIPLVDLNTRSLEVRAGYSKWISELVSNYSIDGLRIDTVRHVELSFWRGFNDAAGVFCTGEILDGRIFYDQPYQTVLDSYLNYPLYYAMIDVFRSPLGDMNALVSNLSVNAYYSHDPTVLTTFSENHDQPRFPDINEDMVLVKNVLALNILGDGIPIIYYGQEQHFGGAGDPFNREAL